MTGLTEVLSLDFHVRCVPFKLDESDFTAQNAPMKQIDDNNDNDSEPHGVNNQCNSLACNNNQLLVDPKAAGFNQQHLLFASSAALSQPQWWLGFSRSLVAFSHVAHPHTKPLFETHELIVSDMWQTALCGKPPCEG